MVISLLLSGTTLSASPLLLQSPYVTVQPVQTVAPETIEDRIDRIALSHGVATTTLFNLVKNESNFNPDARGDHGCSLGLTQQNVCANKEVTEKEAFDPEWALTKAAEDIKNGDDYKYMVCNCWGYLKANYLPTLPNTKNLLPNSMARVGAVAIYHYGEINHYAYVTSVGEGSYSEIAANLKPCDIGRRTVSVTNPALVGFWYPGGDDGMAG